MELCRDELTVTPEDLSEDFHLVAVVKNRLVAFVQTSVNGDILELEKLFVDPRMFRRGIGAALLKAACREGLSAGFQFMMIDSDPGAETFYTGLGATEAGTAQSLSVPGRTLRRFSIACNLHNDSGS